MTRVLLVPDEFADRLSVWLNRRGVTLDEAQAVLIDGNFVLAVERRPEPDARNLSTRGVQILRGAAQGKSNRVIGAELFVSENTVKTHLRRLYRAIGARDRANAVHAGHLLGLLSDLPLLPESEKDGASDV